VRALRIRKPRAPAGTRRFTRATRPPPRRTPTGPWPPRRAVYFDMVRRFARRNGHARVPQPYREGGSALGAWVALLRREYRMGMLSPEQARSLEALPGWSWSPSEDHFLERVELLRAYLRRGGCPRIPSDHRENGVALAHWAEHLRSLYRAGRLAEPRIRVLERIPGWAWDPRAGLFEQGLAAARAFAAREGHLRVPTGHVERGVRLDIWVNKRREDRRKGRLSRERIRALERVPHWTWSARESSFEEAWARLQRFVKREGHAHVPVAHVEGDFPLGAWVHKQRIRRQRMDLARARRLASLPGWAWNAFEVQFESGLRALGAFVKREGHAEVPAKHVEGGFPLGRWVSHCRARKRGLRADRRKALEAVPGWKWRVRPRRRRGGRGAP